MLPETENSSSQKGGAARKIIDRDGKFVIIKDRNDMFREDDRISEKPAADMPGKEAQKMKKLYLIGGTMGVGKTTVCQILKQKLEQAVFLDGDWCWDAHPFQVNEETKAMVMDNICYLLNNFLSCSAYRNIIFCWVMHEQSIVDSILSRLCLEDCEVKNISLICSREALSRRLEKDIRAGIRQRDVLERSMDRLKLYQTLNTVKVDVSEISAEEAAEKIMGLG